MKQAQRFARQPVDQVDPDTLLDEQLLDRRFNAILLQLRLLSTVDAVSYGPGGGHPSSKPPAGEGSMMVDRLISRYKQALSDTGRLKVIRHAAQHLAAARRRDAPPPAESISLDQVVIDDGAGFTCEEVGQRYGLAAAHVARIRHRAGRDLETGTIPNNVDLAREDRQREALRMRDKGMTTRQIAFSLNCSQALVVKDLKA